MIFVTTGTQAPFDRLLRIIDRMAEQIDEEIIVQAFPDKYIPVNVKCVDFMSPDEFDRVFRQARLIVAHAGMGTIITAMQLSKPIVIFPRIAALGEHRNEHQTTTARQMEAVKYAHVAFDEQQLEQYIMSEQLPVLYTLGDTASPSLIGSLKDFLG